MKELVKELNIRLSRMQDPFSNGTQQKSFYIYSVID